MNRDKLLFRFIKRREADLEKITDVQIKDEDDENGMIGEHFVVKCVLKHLSISNRYFTEEKTCLVDRSVFFKWVKKQKAVKWL